MYNLYQSKIRKDIQTQVYGHPFFEIDLFGKKYFGLIKKKKIGPIGLQRLQVLGVEIPDNKSYVQAELKKLKEKYGNKKKNILFQLGIMNELSHFNNYEECLETNITEIVQQRESTQQLFSQEYNLRPSFRENMPNANIFYDVQKEDKILLQEMSNSSAKRVKKGNKAGICFDLANKNQYQQFFIKWKEIARSKKFHTVSEKQFLNLMDYLDKNQAGALFISHINQNIMSGSICLFDDGIITYLYGFSSREKQNIGGHQFLKFKMFQRARENGFTTINALGGAPTGVKNHPLEGVSKFKESMGGYKVEHYGSFDLVLNSLTYGLFKKYFKWKK